MCRRAKNQSTTKVKERMYLEWSVDEVKEGLGREGRIYDRMAGREAERDG